MNSEKEGGEDGALRELRHAGRARLLPSRDSSVFNPWLKGCADSFQAGFGGGCMVDALEGPGREVAHVLVVIG